MWAIEICRKFVINGNEGFCWTREGVSFYSRMHVDGGLPGTGHGLVRSGTVRRGMVWQGREYRSPQSLDWGFLAFGRGVTKPGCPRSDRCELVRVQGLENVLEANQGAASSAHSGKDDRVSLSTFPSNAVSATWREALNVRPNHRVSKLQFLPSCGVPRQNKDDKASIGKNRIPYLMMWEPWASTLLENGRKPLAKLISHRAEKR